MKSLNYVLLRVVCALIVGLVLVLFPDRAGEYLVITLGVVFVIPALAGIIAYFVQGRKKGLRFPLEGMGSLLFGLWLIVMPDFFADLLTIVLGIVLILGGIQEIVSFLYIRRAIPVSLWFYVVPVLILVAGIVAVFNPTGVRSVAFMIVGISSMVYALSELLTWLVFRRRMKNLSSIRAKDFTNVEDAEIVEED